jgi:hypothetical protein
MGGAEKAEKQLQRLSYMSALQFKPVPSRLGMVLGSGREDLFWPNVPGWLDPSRLCAWWIVVVQIRCVGREENCMVMKRVL